MKAMLATILVALWALSSSKTTAGNPEPSQANRALLDCSGQLRLSVEDLCQQAISPDSAAADRAIHELRARGESGLRALVEAHASTLQRPPAERKVNDPAWQRLRAALDGVSGQRDCHAAQLFWFTDFEQARAAARAQAKPILSLRLLGRLDEEFSCANSRFFRTTLYANAEVAKYLREHFILHWQSVRPVPRVTIDFGDGRKLERTLTGNSIHYVLDSSGEVVDALPGLYSAKAFIAGLERAEDTVQRLTKASAVEHPVMLAKYHRTRLAELDAALAADLQEVSASPSASYVLDLSPIPQLIAFSPPSAQAAAKVAVGKGFVERPILDRTQPPGLRNIRGSSAGIDDETWVKLANLHADEATLDAGAVALIREKTPSARVAGRLTASKIAVEDPTLRQIRNLQRSISEDTVRNEYSLHRQLHAWFADGAAPRNVDALNTRVYAELFLTPDSDPWLGLLPPDNFAALENGGVKIAAQK